MHCNPLLLFWRCLADHKVKANTCSVENKAADLTWKKITAWLYQVTQKPGHNDMRSTKAWQMEAGSFETTVASMVSVQVCTYHYLFICTQALTYGGRVLGTGQKESYTVQRKDEDKEKTRVKEGAYYWACCWWWCCSGFSGWVATLQWSSREKSLIRLLHEAIYGWMVM